MKELANQKRKCLQKQNQSIDADERLNRFKEATRFEPIFICKCCERKLFEKQIVEVNMESFKKVVNENESGLFSQCINIYSKKTFSTLFCESKDAKSSFEIDT